MQKKKAVVLFSGGLDSFTTLAIARDKGYSVYALTIMYNQRHSVEVEVAKNAIKTMPDVTHKVFEVDLSQMCDSPLTGSGDVPKGDLEQEGVAATYVPARNMIFLSLALAKAESIGADRVFIGVNSVDYSGYPDCRPGFIEAFQQATDQGTRAGVQGEPIKIEAPLLNMTKTEIIQKGVALGLDFNLTHSCYSPIEGNACGDCDSCLIRNTAFTSLEGG